MSDPLQCARGDSLQEEERGVADFSEADRNSMEAREDFWSTIRPEINSNDFGRF